MQPLDYETPRKNERRPPFWWPFALAYLPGVLVLNGTDDMLHRRLTGHPNDGTVIILSLFVSPLFAGGAALIRTICKRYNTTGLAVAFAIFAPLLIYLVWVAADVFSK